MNKNSSGDEIANVNFLRRYRTRTSKYQKENLLRLTDYTIARKVLRIKSWIYESVTEFQPCSYRIFIPWVSRGPSADVYY